MAGNNSVRHCADSRLLLARSVYVVDTEVPVQTLDGLFVSGMRCAACVSCRTASRFGRGGKIQPVFSDRPAVFGSGDCIACVARTHRGGFASCGGVACDGVWVCDAVFCLVDCAQFIEFIKNAFNSKFSVSLLIGKFR